MAQQTINVGTAPNDGTGTPLRTAFQYTNSNFSELYTAVGPSGNNIVVPGSATITGDLTVRTNKLKVDSTGVAIGATSASYLLDVRGTDTTNALIAGTTKGIRFVASASTSAIVGVDNTGAASYQPLSIGGSALDFSLSGSPAMTLNSTGLGIGVASPATKLDVRGATDANQATFSGTAGRGLLISTRSDGLANDRTVILNAQHSTGSLGQLVIQTAGTDRLLVDNSGNVGIGVAPSAWKTNFKALQFGPYTVGYGSIYTDDAGNTWFNSLNFQSATTRQYVANGNAAAYRLTTTGQHQWYTDSVGGVTSGTVTFTQAMTLDSGGKLVLGTTAAYNAARLTVQSAGGAGGIATAIQNDNDSYYAINFRNSAGTSCGSISCLTSSTAFNTSSDYRLKESVQPIIGALSRISALKPSIYKWKVDGSSGEGFLAHELAETVPLAVTGEKDAINEDGSIKPQQVDLSKVVPILVAAIQELTARVQTLETR